LAQIAGYYWISIEQAELLVMYTSAHRATQVTTTLKSCKFFTQQHSSIQSLAHQATHSNDSQAFHTTQFAGY
jgi:hypothetical protein